MIEATKEIDLIEVDTNTTEITEEAPVGVKIRKIVCSTCSDFNVPLRRIDVPVKAYVCERCIRFSKSSVFKAGPKLKRHVLLGPLADTLIAYKALYK